MKLNNEILLNAERRDKIYKLYDGGGLCAEIPPSGNIRWRIKYSILGKEKRLSLGVYPEVSLDYARQKCAELKAQIKTGIDPALERRNLKIKLEVSKFKIPKTDRVKYLESTIDFIRQGLSDLLKEVKENG